MARTYTSNAGRLLDELSALGIDSAQELASVAGIARNTAGAVMRGDSVTLQTVNAVVKGLQLMRLSDEQLKPSHLFDVHEGGAE